MKASPVIFAPGATPTPQAAAGIEAALAEVSKWLEAGDLVAAAASIQGLVAFCQAAVGTKFNADQIARLSQLLQRCTDLASTAEGRLTTSLALFGNGARARRAYQDG